MHASDPISTEVFSVVIQAGFPLNGSAADKDHSDPGDVQVILVIEVEFGVTPNHPKLVVFSGFFVGETW